MSTEDAGAPISDDRAHPARQRVRRIDDDVWRRDFTVNALYYDIQISRSSITSAGSKTSSAAPLRLIGDPLLRYREDPVRMLRAVRFAVKLGFTIDDSTARPFAELGQSLEEISSARLFDEMIKLFHGGCALQTFEALRHHRLFEHLFPLAEQTLAHEQAGFPATLIHRALANTDARINAGKSVTPAFLVAALLWDAVDEQRLELEANGVSEQDALGMAADTVISRQVARIAFPRRFTQMTREIWALQSRLARRTPKRVHKVSEHPRFRAAYDFLVIRAEAGEPVEEPAEWWTRYQEVGEGERERMLAALKGGEGKSRRRRRRGPA